VGSAGLLQINVSIAMNAAGNATDDVCARLPHNLGVKAKYRNAKLESGRHHVVSMKTSKG